MSNKLKINQKGNLLPKYPSRSFDKRNSLITNPMTNMNSAPLFYIGPRVNTLWSSTSPAMPYAFAIMKYGNLNSMHKVYGNIHNSIGNKYPNKYTNFNLTVDPKGNYKLVNELGKSFKVHYDTNGGYLKYNKQKIYL
jgi:hypothetical protein